MHTCKNKEINEICVSWNKYSTDFWCSVDVSFEIWSHSFVIRFCVVFAYHVL